MSASWLAYTLAQAGLQVLLVNANGQPSRPFNGPGAPGVLDEDGLHTLLQQSPEQASAWLHQRATHVPNLYFLPAYVQETEETMRWAASLQQLTTWLMQQPMGVLDLILIDAPALESGSTSIALAPVTEGTILVIEAGKVRAEDLVRAQATLQRLGSPILGVVVNRQKASHRPYFYAGFPRHDDAAAERWATESVVLTPTPSPARPGTNMVMSVRQADVPSLDGDHVQS
jgi:Mrp family chromosome partitioning ATPase